MWPSAAQSDDEGRVERGTRRQEELSRRAELERLYTSWARAATGLVVTGNVMVDRRQLGEPGNVVIEDERNLDALSRWAKAAKDAAVRAMWVQLNHPGRQVQPASSGALRRAQSGGVKGPVSATPRELTSEEILKTSSSVSRPRAGCVETAGFDGVQIHGAHGYLISQFLSPAVQPARRRVGR